MAHHFLCLVIGYFNAIAYSLWILYSIYAVITVTIIVRDEVEKYSGHWSGLLYSFLIINMVQCIGMLIASIFLIVGIHKKRHQFIAPWMYITAIAIILMILQMLNRVSIFYLIVIAIQLAMWYPIYLLYKELRNHPHNQQQMTQFSGNTVHNPYLDNQVDTYAVPAYGHQTQPAVYNQPSSQPLYPSVTYNVTPYNTRQ